MKPFSFSTGLLIKIYIHKNKKIEREFFMLDFLSRLVGVSTEQNVENTLSTCIGNEKACYSSLRLVINTGFCLLHDHSLLAQNNNKYLENH